MTLSPYSVEVEGLGKAYRRYASRMGHVLGSLGLGRLSRHADVWALRDVDLRLARGGTLGVCGANGAGKSTLLRLLAGITAPTTGRYRIHGSVSSILEIGAGFHPGFSGRENIELHAVLMGLRRREVRRKAQEIVDFAELGAAIDDPLRTYSAGMAMRLGFSVAVATSPSLLLIDEVFAVGDVRFQKKCIDKITAFKRAGTTVLLCTHSLYDLRQLCEEAIWIHEGAIVSRGDPVRVTNDYASFQKQRMEGADLVLHSGGEPAPVAGERPHVVAVEIWREGSPGPVSEVTTGEPLELRIWWRNPDPERFPIHVAVGFLRHDRVLCAGTGTHLNGEAPRGSSGCTVLRLPDLRLLAGRYLMPVWILDEHGVHRYQEYLVPTELVVRSETRQVGVFLPDSEWIQRDDLPPPGPDGTGHGA